MSITTRRLTPALGVEIRGVDISKPLSDDDRRDIRAAWLDGLVAVFPGQQLDSNQQSEFAKNFGDLQLLPDQIPGQEQTVVYVANRTVEGLEGRLPTGEMNFHMDMCYLERPCAASFLFGIEVPTEGGATRFANAYRAYETLPDDVKEKINGLNAVQLYDYDGTPTIRVEKPGADGPSFVHPVVVRHPETQKPLLFVNRLMTDHIEGLIRDESDALLELLFTALEAEDNVYDHQWSVGDLLLWDNRSTLHARTDFNPEEARVLRRVTVQGDRPQAAFPEAHPATV